MSKHYITPERVASLNKYLADGKVIGYQKAWQEHKERMKKDTPKPELKRSGTYEVFVTLGENKTECYYVRIHSQGDGIRESLISSAMSKATELDGANVVSIDAIQYCWQ